MVNLDFRSLWRFGLLLLCVVQVGAQFVDPVALAGQQSVSGLAEVGGQPFVGNSCEEATAVVPVLLVTGWSGSAAEGLAADDQLHYFINWMGSHGYKEGCNLFYAQGMTPHESLAVNGALIQDNLCAYAATVAARHPNWDGEFQIVGHSYGGLRARAYLENEALNGRCPHSSQPIHVTTLVTMGTPHGGAWPNLPLSAYIGATSVLRGSEWPAIWEMLPPTRLLQNAVSHQPDGTCYYLLGGDARSQWVIFLSTLALHYFTGYGGPVLAEGNDLAVWLDSAHQLTDPQWGLSLNYPNSTTITTPDVHGQIPGAVGVRSFVNPRTTFEQVIWPLLNGNTDCQAAQRQPAAAATVLAEQRWRGVAALQQSHTEVGVPLQDVAAGELAAGELAEGSFVVEEGGRTAVTLHWSDGGLGLTLVNPNGRVIDPQTAVSDPTIRYGKFDGGLGLLATYVLQAPLPGTWHYRIVAEDGGETAVYRLVRLSATPLVVSSSVPQWLPASSMVPIVATVRYDDSQPVLGSTVVAEVARPDGGRQSLVLLDDGKHGDGAANDGVYGGDFGPAAGGSYGVLLRAQGSFADKPYQRTTTAVFTIAPATANLTGSQADVGLREGVLLTKLAVDVGVAVVQSSRLTLTADLYAGETFITQATTTVTLAAGEQTMRLLFAGEAIRDSGLDGPYTLRHLLLLDNEPELLLVEQVAVGGETAVYGHEEFGRLWRGYLPLIR